jgi:hypothetical protein
VHVTVGQERQRVGAELRRLAAMGAQSVTFGVTHTEPTTHPDFPGIVSDAKSLGFKNILLATSGVALASRELADRLRDSGLSLVVLTLAGLEPDISDVLLGRRGATEAKLATIRNALGAGLRVVASFAMLRPALHRLPDDARTLTAMHERSPGLSVRALLLDAVPHASRERFALLWPRYGEAAWAADQLRRWKRDFVVEARRIPVCVARRLAAQVTGPVPAPEPDAVVKCDSACDGCADAAECSGIDRIYWEAHGGPLLPAKGVLVPSAPERDALARLLLPTGEVPVAGVARAQAWQRRALQLLELHRAGGEALHGYFLQECRHQPDSSVLCWHGEAGPMNLIVGLRADSPRYFIAGERFCVSYRAETPPDAPSSRALMDAVLQRLERDVAL